MAFKIATHIYTAPTMTTKLLKAVKEAGFDGVAANLNGAQNYLRLDNWREKMKEARKMIEGEGLTCVQTHLPVYYIRRPSDEYNEEETILIERGIEANAILGCKWGAYHLRSDFNHDFNVENAMRDNYNDLCRFIKVAEEFDTGIALENLPIFPVIKHIKFFSSNYKDIITLADKFDSKHIGICWDTGHANIMENYEAFRQADAIREIGSRIKIVHMHSNVGDADGHDPAGEGIAPWSGIIPALVETGFDGYFTSEAGFPEKNEALYPSALKYHADSIKWLNTFVK